MERERWWQPPQLHREGEVGEERRVSWLELFFDLTFVVVIAQLAHGLSGHIDPNGAFQFVLLFVPVWWVWIAATIYNDRFETGDISYRLITLAYMVPVVAMAVFVYDGLGKTAIAFALSYIASRLIVIGMWLRAGWHVRAFRPVSNRYVIAFGISVVLWLVSLFVDPPVRYLLWAAGLFIDLVAPVFTIAQQRRLPPLTASKLSERLGLFALIVLGESVVSVVTGIANAETITAGTLVGGVLGLVLAFAIWWLYFDFVSRRSFRPTPFWRMASIYGHLPLVMAITAAGAGILPLIQRSGEAVPPAVRLLCCIAVGTVLLAIAFIEWTMRPDADEPNRPLPSIGIKLIAGLLVFGLAVVPIDLSSLALLVAFIVLFVPSMVYGTVVWFHRPIARTSDPEIEPAYSGSH